MNRTAVTWSIAIALAAGTAPWARAESSEPLGNRPSPRSVTLDVNRAAPADVAQRLGEMLGAEIRFDGTLPETLSLSLTELPVTAAMDRLASEVGGKWERVYRLSKNDAPRETPAAPSGLTVTLRLADVPCATAAKMVARATKARLEVDGEMTGTVTLSAADMPAEEALDAIARAAGMEWRMVYLVHGSYVAPVVSAPMSQPAPRTVAPPADTAPVERDPTVKPSTKRVRPSQRKREPRTKYNQIGPLGAKAPPARPPMDLQKAEELAKLGQFAGIFACEDETERKQRIKRFIAGLESQARKLENFEPRGRVSALRILAIQLQQYISDFEALNDAQKKEVQPLMDKINERMTEIQAIINRPR